MCDSAVGVALCTTVQYLNAVRNPACASICCVPGFHILLCAIPCTTLQIPELMMYQALLSQYCISLVCQHSLCDGRHLYQLVCCGMSFPLWQHRACHVSAGHTAGELGFNGCWVVRAVGCICEAFPTGWAECSVAARWMLPHWWLPWAAPVLPL